MQLYQMGQVAMSASKHKARLADPEPGMPMSHLNVLSIISDDALLFIARTCDIDMGRGKGD